MEKKRWIFEEVDSLYKRLSTRLYESAPEQWDKIWAHYYKMIRNNVSLEVFVLYHLWKDDVHKHVSVIQTIAEHVYGKCSIEYVMALYRKHYGENSENVRLNGNIYDIV